MLSELTTRERAQIKMDKDMAIAMDLQCMCGKTPCKCNLFAKIMEITDTVAFCDNGYIRYLEVKNDS